MQVSPMFQTMQDYAALGYRVSNSYADGVILMIRDSARGADRVFITADGCHVTRYAIPAGF